MTCAVRHSIALGAACIALLAGCVQMPTEHQGAVDIRPVLGFSVPAESGIDSAKARVLIDGLDAGPLSNFQNSAGTLRVLPGSHLVQVKDGPRLLFEDKVFLPDGAHRSFNLSGVETR